MTRIAVIVFAALLVAGCVTHVHPRYPNWAAYKKGHPNASYVVVHSRPARHRTCWNLRPGVWRCVR